MRSNLALFLRRLGRASLRAADRVQPDPITRALDIAYAPPSDEARAWSDADIAAELREIRGTLKPWHPEKLTAFQRRQRARQ